LEKLQSTFSLARSLEALLVLTIAVHAVFFSWSAVRAKESKIKPAATAPYTINGLVEAEQLKVMAKNREFAVLPQSTTTFLMAKWSGDRHLFFQTTKEGDWVELALPVVAKGRHRILAYFTRSFDYGRVQLSVNGKPTEAMVELSSFGEGVFSSGPVRVGEFDLAPGDNRLRIQVVGHDKSNRAPHFLFGLDGIKIEPL